jgi:LPS-assembly protein
MRIIFNTKDKNNKIPVKKKASHHIITGLTGLMALTSCIATAAPARNCVAPKAQRRWRAHAESPLTTLQGIANNLGWVTAANSHNICGGYYDEPIIPGKISDLKLPHDTTISADTASLFRAGRSTLRGHVVVNQPSRQLTADRAFLYRDGKNGKIKRIELFGHVTLREQGRLLVGNKATVLIRTDESTIKHAIYRISLSNEKSAEKGIYHLYGLNGWGRACRIQRLSSGNYILHHATYATCPPTKTAWELSATKIKLNKKSGRGVARNVVMRIKKVPVFYLPYFSFPINDQRKSGFLFPTFAYSTSSGGDFSIPYYLNLAPNYDATITPRLITLRGLMLNGQFRYLTQTSEGMVEGSYLPSDRRFKQFKQENPAINYGGNDRGSIHLVNHTTINRHWTSNIDVGNVSDDYYFQDFGNNIAVSTKNQVLRQGQIAYSDQYVNFMGMLQNYQTLHPINTTATSDQYSHVPELVFNAQYPDQLGGFNLGLNSQFDNFMWPVKDSGKTIGYRIFAAPTISRPVNRLAGYFTPTATLMLRHYGLKDQPEFMSDDIDSSIPVLSVDSGLFLERNFHLFHSDFTQTFEPRVFYTYVPYRDQSNIPVFDSGYYIFGYDQLFRTNRFSGFDRIGDTNKVSVGLTTRVLNQYTGQEIVSLSVGESIFFSRRKVMLCTKPGCMDTSQINLGVINPAERVSPIAGKATVHISKNWSARGSLSWNPNTRQLYNGAYYFHYQPIANHIINLGYSFLRNGGGTLPTQTGASSSQVVNLNQINTGFAWPLNNHWSALGAWGYNISHRYPSTYLFGIQYNSCCWAVRAMAGRFFTHLDSSNNPQFHSSVYIQFLFKGLGTVGSGDPRQVLGANVPGYTDMFAYK